MLAVRRQSSFYKSVFNHLCNKQTKSKVEWRRENHVNCSNEGEFVRLIELDSREMAAHISPFLVKEAIMQSNEVQTLMLVDYKCVPQIVQLLCGDFMSLSINRLDGKKMNSAEEQNNTDYWSMYSRTTFAPFNPFWDIIYDKLSQMCCLELARLD
jgi:hypothetical protein